MFDFDDMIHGFAVALAIFIVGAGCIASIYCSLVYGGEYGRVLAVATGGVWVYFSFRLIRFFRMRGLEDKIHRDEFFLQYLPSTDPDRLKLEKHREKAFEQLNIFRED